MSLTVVKRPQGYVLDTTAVTASQSVYPGDATFSKISHGLSTGDYIYIYSQFSEYNGYWYVDVAGVNTFNIREYATASKVQAFATGTVTYYKSVLTHNWSCVHLPIIYKIQSNLWPTNSADTARTINTFVNYNGYTYIVAAGDIKATGTASTLERVVLSGTSVDGNYRIIQWFSDTNFVIDLVYSAANTLSTGTVQYYYSNYHARIKVYAGIASAHPCTTKKPYEMVAEIPGYPDSTGLITINISDIVKSKINPILNNNLLDTLPNNIDAWCNFYISTAESYDDSNGYTVSESVTSYTSDSGTFEGYAANAKLPFKTRSAGALSQYVVGGTSATYQKFLTGFTRPSLWPGKYFDIAFIKNNSTAGDYIKREVYLDSVKKDEFITTFTNLEQGIYRLSISQSGWVEDRIDITLYNSSNVQLSETLTIDVVNKCSPQDFYLVWLNNLGGYDYWNFRARKVYSTDVIESQTQEVNIFNDYPNSYGEFADSITKQTVRRTKDAITVTTQLLTSAQEDSIKRIVSSPLVQICTSQYDRQTLLVDTNSLNVRRDQDKAKTLSIGVVYTDEVPSQTA